MSQQGFFDERAREARTDAEAAALPNVRDRCLRAAAAWDAMADRERRIAANRIRREAERQANLPGDAATA